MKVVPVIHRERTTTNPRCCYSLSDISNHVLFSFIIRLLIRVFLNFLRCKHWHYTFSSKAKRVSSSSSSSFASSSSSSPPPPQSRRTRPPSRTRISPAMAPHSIGESASDTTAATAINPPHVIIIGAGTVPNPIFSILSPCSRHPIGGPSISKYSPV